MITLAYTVSIALILALPLTLAALLRRRFAAPWFLFLAGAATFALSQAAHLPLNGWLADIGLLPKNAMSTETIPLWQTCLILGLTAGLCEELARAAGYALLRHYRRFEHGLLLGLGHGGIEALALGGILTAASVSSLLALRDSVAQGVDLATLSTSAEQLAHLNTQLATLEHFALWMALPPLVERALAIGIHGVCSMLVWRAFARRRWGYLALAIAYHALVDAGLGYLAQFTTNLWLIYGALIALLLPGAYWLWRVWRAEAGPHAPVAPWSVEWRAFRAAVRKELLQQWRTRRVLVVGAVFILFGLMSPLLAYFTPQMLRAIPEAAQFADLIPTPTAADAVAQYVKNLTQFGFLMAILLGMGAVASEKEHHTAALILSKPLPRWAFVLSKFTAQALLYLGGFIVATLGAYYYTVVLFGPVNLGAFAFSNVLLPAWLLPFAALALLGSVLGKSIGAAAGIGFGASVLLLLADQLPRVGALAPGGLLAWATQVGMGLNTAPVTPNAGALVASIVLVMLCLIGALAAFERQEL